MDAFVRDQGGAIRNAQTLAELKNTHQALTNLSQHYAGKEILHIENMIRHYCKHDPTKASALQKALSDVPVEQRIHVTFKDFLDANQEHTILRYKKNYQKAIEIDDENDPTQNKTPG